MSTSRRKSWDQFFLDHARLYASRSKDPSTKVGSVIVGDHNTVLVGGFNGFPRGLPDVYTTRPQKLKRTVHAEANAILNAARHGVKTAGTTLYVLSESGKYSMPCGACAAAIVQAGISQVVIENTNVPRRWWNDAKLALEMFREGGVMLRLADMSYAIEWPEHLVKTKD